MHVVTIKKRMNQSTIDDINYYINKYNDYLKKYPNDSKKYYIMFNNQLGNYISNKALDTDAADVFEKLKFEASYGKNSIKPIDINYWKRKIVNEDCFNY